MTYTLEIKEAYALRIIKELQKVDAVKLRKIPNRKSITEEDEDAVLLELMKEADFSETVSTDSILAKLKVK